MRFNKKQIEFIKQNYENTLAKDMVKLKMFKGFRQRSIQGKAHSFGIKRSWTGQRNLLWTEEDYNYLRKNYQKHSALDIGKVMNRSRCAVIMQLSRLKLKKDRTGCNNANWKGGRQITKRGYVLLSNKQECPYSNSKGRVPEHIYIWWKNYGMEKPILMGEVIHHKNLNKSDNRIENLKKVTRGEHNQIHSKVKPDRKDTL